MALGSDDISTWENDAMILEELNLFDTIDEEAPGEATLSLNMTRSTYKQTQTRPRI